MAATPPRTRRAPPTPTPTPTPIAVEWLLLLVLEDVFVGVAEVVDDATEPVVLADAPIGPAEDEPAEDRPDDAADDAEVVDTCVLVYASPIIVKVYGCPEKDIVSYAELHLQLS